MRLFCDGKDSCNLGDAGPEVVDGLDDGKCGYTVVEGWGAPAMSEVVLLAEAVNGGKALIEDGVVEVF